MKNLLIGILKWKLRMLARATLVRYRPSIVGITGTVGKTSTKEAIFAVLSRERTVRANPANFNNELGLPLAILSDARRISRPVTWFWLMVMLGAIKRIIFYDRNYPSVLVLEYGADRPGDIARLLAIAQPNTAVVTAVGDIPVHVEYYAGPKAVAKEKSELVKQLGPSDFAVLNHDDLTVLDMRRDTRARIVTYGLGEGADVRATAFEHRLVDGVPSGLGFKLEYGGSFVPVRLRNTYGKAQAYAAAAAAAVGLSFGMNIIHISEALGNYQAPPGRMKLVAGLKGSRVLDDTYNASPASMHAALDTLRDLPARRRVAILGDMLEIGRYAMEAHAAAGRMAAESCDLLITVGPRAKFIAEGAREAGMKKKAITSYDLVDDEMLRAVHGLLEEGDLILVKASRAIHLEKVVEEIRNPIES